MGAGEENELPLTGRPDTDIGELTRKCKTRGKFGNLPRMGFERCHRAAIAAGLSTERRMKRDRKKKGKAKGRMPKGRY